MKKKLLSFLLSKVGVFCVLFAALSLYSCSFNKERIGGIIYSDMEGYYVYLPGVFIYPGFKDIPVKTKEHFTVDSNTHKLFTKYTYGVALLESPFFFMAHAGQLIFDTKAANGYADVYSGSVIVAGCFYCLLGLFLLFYTLKQKFSSSISILTLIAVFGGSNLYYYTICQPDMSHVYSFFLFSLFVYLTPRILNSSNLKLWIAYGFVFGLIILIRPTNSILLLYPLLYGCYSPSAFMARVIFFLNRYKLILVAAFFTLIVFIPQLLYWKYLFGSFFYYSYRQEGFDYWKNPKIWKVLFDVQNGWLLYSPLMILAVLGVFINLKKRAAEALPTIIILCIATYLFASWWLWFFGGAFGHRCFVEFYAFLSFGLAGFLSISSRNRYFGLFTGLIICLCIYYNLRLTAVYDGSWEGASWTWDKFTWLVKHGVF